MQKINEQVIKTWFNQNKVFAYPTEAVFGLGCNPLSEEAVDKILSLKSRPVEKGMILIASSLDQLRPFIKFEDVARENQSRIIATWPGPYTWLIPKSKHTPWWVSGDSEFVAVRVTSHPIVRAICDAVESPIISTSANPAGLEPARSEVEVGKYFGEQVELVSGALGDQAQPSTIIHSLTLQTLR